MKTVADRSSVEASIRNALVGSSIQKLTYAITHWRLEFLGTSETRLEASEILLPDQIEPEEDSRQAVLVGNVLLGLTNQAKVESVALRIGGDMEIHFSHGHTIRVVGRIPHVDWAWSIEAPQFQFTCDGSWDD